VFPCVQFIAAGSEHRLISFDERGSSLAMMSKANVSNTSPTLPMAATDVDWSMSGAVLLSVVGISAAKNLMELLRLPSCGQLRRMPRVHTTPGDARGLLSRVNPAVAC